MYIRMADILLFLIVWFFCLTIWDIVWLSKTMRGYRNYEGGSFLDYYEEKLLRSKSSIRRKLAFLYTARQFRFRYILVIISSFLLAIGFVLLWVLLENNGFHDLIWQKM